LDQVGVPDPMPVLAWEAQEHCQLGQGVGQAGDRGWVAPVVAVGEGVGASAGLGDCLVAGRGVDVVEDLPERGLDLGLGVVGDLGQDVAGTVKLGRNYGWFLGLVMVGVVCAACAYRWRSVSSSPPGSRRCCRT